MGILLLFTLLFLVFLLFIEKILKCLLKQFEFEFKIKGWMHIANIKMKIND